MFYIYGGGRCAGKKTQEFLEKFLNVHCAGVVVSKKYYDATQPDLICLEDLLESAEKPIALIVAFRDFDENAIPKVLKSKISTILRYDCWSASRFRDLHMSEYEWLCSKEKEFHRVYDALQDEKSKQVFIAYLNQKISMKLGYMAKVKSPIQYFEDDLITFSNNEVFVDCGAYDGDSALAFIAALKRQKIDSYEQIIAFEPDEVNYAKLCAKKIDKCMAVKKGVSDKAQVLFFSQSDTSSAVCETGETKIEVDTIDNVVGSKNVTMIKMDIEGAELGALQRAAQTIKRCHPRLAICAYHKREDLYELSQFILGLDSMYKLYLRCYEDFSNEVVLYAL